MNQYLNLGINYCVCVCVLEQEADLRTANRFSKNDERGAGKKGIMSPVPSRQGNAEAYFLSVCVCFRNLWCEYRESESVCSYGMLWKLWLQEECMSVCVQFLQLFMPGISYHLRALQG